MANLHHAGEDTQDWDLNPWAWNSAQPKLRLRPDPTVFQLRSHAWSQNLIKLRFSMSHCRKNSVRDRVIDRKWIYLDTQSIDRLQSISKGEMRMALGETLSTDRVCG